MRGTIKQKNPRSCFQYGDFMKVDVLKERVSSLKF